MIKLAKQEIRKRGEKDFEVNYAWAQENLLQVHAEALDRGDHRARVVAIKELVSLWGLQNREEPPKQLEITPEMLEQFEQTILR